MAITPKEIKKKVGEMRITDDGVILSTDSLIDICSEIDESISRSIETDGSDATAVAAQLLAALNSHCVIKTGSITENGQNSFNAYISSSSTYFKWNDGKLAIDTDKIEEKALRVAMTNKCSSDGAVSVLNALVATIPHKCAGTKGDNELRTRINRESVPVTEAVTEFLQSRDDPKSTLNSLKHDLETIGIASFFKFNPKAVSVSINTDEFIKEVKKVKCSNSKRNKKILAVASVLVLIVVAFTLIPPLLEEKNQSVWLYADSASDGSVSVQDSNLEEIMSGLEVTSGGNVNIGVSKGASTADNYSVSFSPAAMAALNERSVSLTVHTPSGNVSLDQDAVRTAANQHLDTALSIDRVDPSELTDDQRNAIREGADLILSLGLSTTPHGLGGKATVTVPYTFKQGESVSSLHIWYLDSAGDVSEVQDVKYSNGLVSFVTDHFSYYVLSFIDASERTYTATFYDEDGTTVLGEARTKVGQFPVFGDPHKQGDAQYSYAFSGWDRPLARMTRDCAYVAGYSQTVNMYKVSFVSDGTVISERTYEYGTAVGEIDVPDASKDADREYTYSFTGWDRDIEVVVADATYTATHSRTPITYTFTFRNGGETVASVEFNVDNMGSKTMPEVPAKDHYDASWDTDAFSLEDKTVNATYVPIRYTFTFTGTDVAINPISFTVEDISSKTMPEVPAKDHYDASWDTDAFSLEDKTVSAVYTPIKYTFTFKNGEETVAVIEFNVENMESKTMPEVPTRDHYSVSWDTEAFSLENRTVNATYVPIKYAFTFNNSGEIVTVVEFNVENMGTKTMPEVPAKDHYDASWDTDVFSLENKTVSAVYVPTEYTITFIDNSGSREVQYDILNTDIEEPVPYYDDTGTWSAKWKDYSLTFEDIIVEAAYEDMFEGYVRVSNENGMKQISSDPAGKYVLASDINITEDWVPLCSIGSLSTFTGILDGNGRKITGLSYSGQYGPGHDGIIRYGLISSVAGDAIIRNIIFDGVDINIDISEDAWHNSYIGAIAGTLSERASIENCTVVDSKISFSSDMDKVYVGAIAGRETSNTSTVGCKVLRTEIYGASHMAFVGAITGELADVSSTTGCELEGNTITAAGIKNGVNDTSNEGYAGGIAGGRWDSANISVDTSSLKNNTIEGISETSFHGSNPICGRVIYTWTFLDDAGNVVGKLYVTQDNFDHVAKPDVPVKDYYEPGQWYPTFSKLETIVFVATYSKETEYTVTFVDDGGSNEVKYSRSTYNYFIEPAVKERDDTWDASWPAYSLNYTNITVTAEYKDRFPGFIRIYDSKDLENMSYDLGAKYVLVNNISYAETDKWTPLGTFTGTLDGNGKTISGLRIYDGTSQWDDGICRFGFFVATSGDAVIKDLTIKSAIVTVPPLKDVRTIRAGILIGNSYDNTQVINCNIVECTITHDGPNKSGTLNISVGGIVGYAEGESSINSCHVYGTQVTAKRYNSYAGGLCGYACSKSKISECTVDGGKILAKCYERSNGFFSGIGCAHAGIFSGGHQSSVTYSNNKHSESEPVSLISNGATAASNVTKSDNGFETNNPEE